jgi:Domain of unknown function (DUF1876)
VTCITRTLSLAATEDEVSEMNETKRWEIVVDIDEHDGRTRAVARLRAGSSDQMVGVGTARLNPHDRDVPQIGDELATARALSELGHHLLHAAAEDIEGVTHQPAHLRL